MKHSDTERAALDAALSRIKLDLDSKKKDLLLDHLKLVIEKNRVLNLTRITSFEEAVVLHIEDSLSVFPEFNEYGGNYLDIGTGGGFPGIPLGIVSGYEGVLLDSVKKKANAVSEFIDVLGLNNQLSAVGLRSEELATQQAGQFDVVIARAVSSLPTVEELAAPLLSSEGHLIAMRGKDSDEDLKSAQIASESLGLELVSVRKFEIGLEEFSRSVCVFEKVSEPKIKLPRRPGMAAKKPLA